MRAFAEAWPDAEIVQQAVGQLPWRYHLVLLTRLKNPQHRLAYAQSAITHGWSRNVLNIQIDKSQPMGIADYKLLESLPAELQSSLPSIEQIERELGGTDTSMENDAQ